MHWVDRGPAPKRLAEVRTRYTPRWVAHYRDNDGDKPDDSRWREFSRDLRDTFNGHCAYCEERCRGEVDHFRPKSRFPDLVYAWENWLFACHDCNHAKRERWPPRGYVDPCAKSPPARPERFFTFDVVTGEILPMEGLNPGRRKKAQTTIDDLRLNEWHHLKNRIEWLQLFSAVIHNEPGELTGEQEKLCAHYSSPLAPFSSITRHWLSMRGHPAGR